MELECGVCGQLLTSVFHWEMSTVRFGKDEHFCLFLFFLFPHAFTPCQRQRQQAPGKDIFRIQRICQIL